MQEIQFDYFRGMEAERQKTVRGSGKLRNTKRRY